MMGHDEDWVANVKRWVQDNPPVVEPVSTPVADDAGESWGYEAAHPALQARHWVEPTDF